MGNRRRDHLIPDSIASLNLIDKMNEQPARTPTFQLTPRPAYDHEATNRRSARFAIVAFALLACVAISLTWLVMTSSVESRRRVGIKHPATGSAIGHVRLAPCANVDKPIAPEDLRDKVVLVNFWGTWCPPCHEEFPHLEKLYAKYKEDPNFVFLSVACGEGDNPDEDVTQLTKNVKAFLATENSSLPVYCDPKQASRIPVAIALKTEMFQYPTTILVDGLGQMVGVWTGYRRGDERDVEKLLDVMLQQAKAGPLIPPVAN